MSSENSSTKKNQDGIVWHYTNAAGLLGIIQNRQLWATHSRFMNDTVEGGVFDGALRAIVAGKDPKFHTSLRSTIDAMYNPGPCGPESRVQTDNRFLLCGSESGDELTLWRNYGQEAVSFAVGLDATAPLGLIHPDGKKTERASREFFSWSKVDYRTPSPTLPSDYEKRLLDAWTKQDFGSTEYDAFGEAIRVVDEVLIELSTVVKNKAFEDERESRVICKCDDGQFWRFRSGRFGLTPYVALGAAEEWGDVSSGNDVLPVRKIRISSQTPDADSLALNALLERNGFDGDLEVHEVTNEDGFPMHHYAVIPPPIEILYSSHTLRM